MTEWKAAGVSWLSNTSLSNLNAGEGSRNVVEVKTYDGGRKPYVSGQAVRHALREAIERANPGVFQCTVEAPCGDVEACWLCDLFGYLNPKLGVGFDRRWSPLKVSPALGMVEKEVVTDLLLRVSPKQKAAEGEEEAARRQMLAYVQLVENVYKVGLVVDIQNLGLMKEPVVQGKGRDAQWAGWKVAKDIGAKERRRRVQEVLLAIPRLADLAKQARGMATMSPDIVLVSLQPQYGHRIQRAFDLNGSGELHLDVFETVVRDLQSMEARLFAGVTPGVIENHEKFLEILGQLGINPTPPVEAIKAAAAAV